MLRFSFNAYNDKKDSNILINAVEDIFSKLMNRDIDNALESSKKWVTRVSEGDFDDKNFVISKTVNLKRKYVN